MSMKYAIKRLSEPSTWASLAVIVGVVSPALSAKAAAVAPALAALAAGLGALLPERKA
jgi:hypothetical protein